MNRERKCKCCEAPAPWFGSVDFAKSCEDRDQPVLPPAGWAVDYFRCDSCGFLFSNFLDDWSNKRLRRDLYNADYTKIDPEILCTRAERISEAIVKIFGGAKAALRVFDYGGGTGGLVDTLRRAGFADITGGDPFFGTASILPSGIDLALCIEVLEHLTKPDAAFADLARHLKPNAVVFFTTMLQPADIATLGMSWWYAAPRNGHVSLHTAKSLAATARRHGFEIASINPTLHVAWRGAPTWAAPLLSKLREMALL